MNLARHRHRRGVRISLVPMVDVLMILLVFFMVTSSYLDLDMMPLAGGEGTADSAEAQGAVPRLFVRIDAGGRIVVRGRATTATDLARTAGEDLARDPGLEVILLPSLQADVQALASTLDALVGAGALRIRVVRLEAGQ